MRIKLDKHYQDVNGVRLTPGEHNVKDILGQYLVTHGHAVRADEPTPAQKAEQKNTLPDTPAGNLVSENAERDSLIAEYEALYDRVAPSNIKTETLREKIAEALADDTGDTDD